MPVAEWAQRLGPAQLVSSCIAIDSTITVIELAHSAWASVCCTVEGHSLALQRGIERSQAKLRRDKQLRTTTTPIVRSRSQVP